MIELLWWHWAIVGFGFILAELMLPAFVLVWFGLGGFLVMLAKLIAPGLGLTPQILLWTVSSLLMMVLWFLVFKHHHHHKSLIGRSSAHIEGRGEVRLPGPRVDNGEYHRPGDEKD